MRAKTFFIVMLQAVLLVGCFSSEEDTATPTAVSSGTSSSSSGNTGSTGNTTGNSAQYLGEIKNRVSSRNFAAVLPNYRFHRFYFKEASPSVDSSTCIFIFTCTSIENNIENSYTLSVENGTMSLSNIPSGGLPFSNIDTLWDYLDTYVNSSNIFQVDKSAVYNGIFGGSDYAIDIYTIYFNNGNYVRISPDMPVYANPIEVGTLQFNYTSRTYNYEYRFFHSYTPTFYNP